MLVLRFYFIIDMLRSAGLLGLTVKPSTGCVTM